MTTSEEATNRNWRERIMLIVVPILQQLLLPVGAIILALLVGAIFILVIGKNPFTAYAALIQGAFGDIFSIGETLENTTPLILTGLAVAFAFRAKLFNIGAEGQFLIGALAATWVGTNLSLPSIIHLPLTLLAGIIAGGLWGGIAGLLKAVRGVHEVISTIMLNFIAIFFISYMVTGPMKEVSSLDIPQTARIADTAVLMKILPPSRLSAGIVIALVAAAFIWWLLWKTTIGYEVRAVGLNYFAAEFGGIKPNYNMFLAMLISGGLAGLGGAIIISGLFLRYQHGFEPGYGFTAIAVSLVGANNPPGVVLAALLFATLSQGALGMQNVAGVPQDIVFVIQALVIFLVAAPQIVQALPQWLAKRREAAQAAAEGTQLEGGQA
ncbi:MAG: ABC transporter permease [Anaerolineae bacterium]|nr:ABC transporter permease [Anaerolineae bacterium]